MKRLPIFLSLLFLHVNSRLLLGSTAIVIIRTPSQVVIGADSKAGLLAEHPSELHLPSSVCKIKASGSTYFSSAGLTRDSDFNADIMLLRLLKQGGAVQRQVVTIADRIKAPFMQAMQRFHKFLPADYARALQSPAPQMTIGIAAIEKNIPVVGLIDFTVINDARGSPTDVHVEIKTCPGNACAGTANQSHFWMYGQYVAAVHQVQNAGAKFWTGNYAEDARRMIGIEIADQPSTVGPPIDILLLDTSGPQWIAPFGQCRNIARQPQKQPRKH